MNINYGSTVTANLFYQY